MTDISVIKMIISVAVWRIYPSWVKDKLRAWEGLGHSGMFWARLSRDDFRSKVKIISSFQSYAHFEEFFVSRAFVRFGAKRSSAWALVLTMSWSSFENSARSPGIFLQTLTTNSSIFLKITFLFQSRAGVTCLTDMVIPRLNKAFLVMVCKKLEWELHFWALARSSEEEPAIIVAIGASRLPWSMVQKRKKKEHRSQRVIVRSLNLHHPQNQLVLKNLFPRPDSTTVLHFAVFMYVDVQLQVGQAAARVQRRKAVIRDVSGVDHRGVTN